MRNEPVAEIRGHRIVVMDSISLIGPHDAGSIIVCGSHGGAISGAFAARHPPELVIFNDAGVGKNQAGIAALSALDDAGVPAAATSHRSARIGDALDGWEHGVISHCNTAAARAGIEVGQPVRAAIERFSAAPGTKQEGRRPEH